MSNPPTTDPALLEALEKAKHHTMTPEEYAEQRRSFARGMCPSHRDYAEWCEQVDKVLGAQDRADTIESLRAEIATLKAKLAETEKPIIAGIPSCDCGATAYGMWADIHSPSCASIGVLRKNAERHGNDQREPRCSTGASAFGKCSRRIRGPTMELHWSVKVERDGEHIVTIESNCLCGREISFEDEVTIRTAAHHLLSFIGDPPPEFFSAKKLER